MRQFPDSTPRFGSPLISRMDDASSSADVATEFTCSAVSLSDPAIPLTPLRDRSNACICDSAPLTTSSAVREMLLTESVITTVFSRTRLTSMLRLSLVFFMRDSFRLARGLSRRAVIQQLVQIQNEHDSVSRRDNSFQIIGA